MQDAAIYNALVALLTYPEADYPQRIEASVQVAPEECRGPLEQFAIQMRGLATDELHEIRRELS